MKTKTDTCETLSIPEHEPLVLSEATLQPEDIRQALSTFLSNLPEAIYPDTIKHYRAANFAYEQDIRDTVQSHTHNAETSIDLAEQLDSILYFHTFEILYSLCEEIAPSTHCFGAHEGNAFDIGYFPLT